MSLTYDATGRKWKKDGEFGAVLYDGGIEYRDGKLEAINLPDGRMVACPLPPRRYHPKVES